MKQGINQCATLLKKLEQIATFRRHWSDNDAAGTWLGPAIRPRDVQRWCDEFLKILSFTSFHILCIKWGFINIFYIALFKILKKMRPQCSLVYIHDGTVHRVWLWKLEGVKYETTDEHFPWYVGRWAISDSALCGSQDRWRRHAQLLSAYHKVSAASLAAGWSDVIRLSLFASFNALINSKYLEVF
jgi:hypothetical protein